MPFCAFEFVTVASHILFAQQGIRASRPAAHLERNGGSRLSRGDGEVVKDRFDLVHAYLRGHDVNSVDAAGVLRGQGGDGTGAVDAGPSGGLEVSLMPAPPLKLKPVMLSATGGVMTRPAEARPGRRPRAVGSA